MGTSAALLPSGDFFGTVQFGTVKRRCLVLQLPPFREIFMVSAGPEVGPACCAGSGVGTAMRTVRRFIRRQRISILHG
jgi:hypothetical protein